MPRFARSFVTTVTPATMDYMVRVRIVKQTKSRLKLNRQTLRTLSVRDLRRVVGGEADPERVDKTITTVDEQKCQSTYSFQRACGDVESKRRLCDR